MDDLESEAAKGCCKRSCCFCACCASCDIREYLKRKSFGIFLLFLGWAVTIYVFTLVKDPDWNIAVMPYLFAFVACAFVSVSCERGTYNRERLGDIYNLQAASKRNPDLDFAEVPDSEASPLLAGPSRNEEAQVPFFRGERAPSTHADELFEPPPVAIQKSNEGTGYCQRDTQLTVQADVHRPVQDPPSPKKSPPESSSTASNSDPQNSSTTPDSGVALQSTAQSTPSVSGGPIPRPPPANPEPQQNPEQPQQNPTSPTEKSTKF